MLVGSKYRLNGYWACHRPQRAVIVFVTNRDPLGYGKYRVGRSIRNMQPRQMPMPVSYGYPKL